HFRGVATVVAKLFNLVQPDAAYFGRKDAQQSLVVGRMIRDLSFPVRLKVLPTVRERDGLAMSSRNRLLSTEARRSSRALFQALQEGRRLIECGERRGAVVARRIRRGIGKIPGAKVDYVAVADPETLQPMARLRGRARLLVAAWIGPVRLIDHIEVRCSAPS
ncbi:MAG: pantoate--beta-alanine ligase, partial [Candidatus Omnitrophica bacterium]|nr:pantoate--beta-alanine ligase [Candidatus Omnitrophota bacterium]